jgi:hypothetical protein
MFHVEHSLAGERGGKAADTAQNWQLAPFCRYYTVLEAHKTERSLTII